MQTITQGRCILDRVNELPTPTWNHLDINAIQLDVPKIATARRLEEEAVAVASSSFACGMGPSATIWLDATAGKRDVVEIAPDHQEAAPVVIDLGAFDNPVQALDLVVGDRASARVALVARRCPEGTPDDAPQPTCGWTVRLRLGQDAHVDLRTFVAAPGWQVLDNLGAVLGDGARLLVQQYYLAGDVVAGGLTCDLLGDQSAVTVDNRYLGRGEQTIDIGHTVRQLGLRTECALTYHGVLAEAASKSLRDTIDLVQGCKGSRGSENETVILAGDEVGCKSLPVILCGEDDVAGDHGATVGELGPAERAYLASRGLAPEDIPPLVMESTFEAAFAAAYVPQASEAVLASAAAVLGDDALEDLSIA